MDHGAHRYQHPARLGVGSLVNGQRHIQVFVGITQNHLVRLVLKQGEDADAIRTALEEFRLDDALVAIMACANTGLAA